MSRVASSLYDGHFQSIQPSPTVDNLAEPDLNTIRFNNNLATNTRGSTRTIEEWESIFPTAAFFEGRDIKLGEVVVMVYEDPDTRKISTCLFSALGELCTSSLTLDERSRFFGACENLTTKMRSSNVRRAIAITLLKAYAACSSIDLSCLRTSSIPVAREWDETIAGELASQMKLITVKSPIELGKQLMAFGFLQQHFTDSATLDVVYADSEDVIEANNKLVFLLGQQLEHLFDPLREYSPESTDVIYKPPERPNNTDDALTRSICQELFQLQESITTQLVKFLREVVIPTRIKALSGKIPELSAAKVNKIFPPTIDEVTRVNCIFFEALKSAVPLGSYEVMKACGSTIPYFYKAYMRHESALKSFSKDQAEFFEQQTHQLPPAYTSSLMSSIMKVPLNLTKIKLILQRLLSTKQWSYLEEPMVQKFYSCCIDTVDSFGKDDLKPYNRRVFTPTGKILTEICEGWPAMLAYGWLNRKVINVFDVKNNADGTSGVVILFNDYIIFAAIEDDSFKDFELIKPKISDVLMNSLMNEKPIKSIPNMKVDCWTELRNLEILAFGNNNVRVIFKNDPQTSMSLTVESASKFMGLINKAKILSKSTPFHLFKNEKFGLSIFATAHEKALYDREQSRSKVTLFLNIDVTPELLHQFDLFAGISARFTDDDMVRVSGLTITGDRSHHTINSVELPGFLSEEVSSIETRRRSAQNLDLFVPLAWANRSFLKKSITACVKEQSPVSSRTASSALSRNMSSGTRATSMSSARVSSLSSVNANKPLPKIVDEDVFKMQEPIPIKKSTKIKNRLSQIFGLKKKNSMASTKSASSKAAPSAPSVTSSLEKPSTQHKTHNTLQEKFNKPQTALNSTRNSSYSSTVGQWNKNLHGNIEDDVPEVSIHDGDTFESSMSPIFDDDLPEPNVQAIAESSTNWVLTRDNSSVNCNLDKFTQLNTAIPQQTISQRSETHETKPVEKFTALFGPQTTAHGTALTAQRPSQQPTICVVQTPSSTPPTINAIPKNLTFRSLEEEFNSPVLRVGVNNGSMEDFRDGDIFYTPKSTKTDCDQFVESDAFKSVNQENMFGSFDGDEDMKKIDGKFDVELEDGQGQDEGEEEEEEEATRWSAGGNDIYAESREKKVLDDAVSLASTKAASFKSCMDDKELIEELKQSDSSLKREDSFSYLAELLNNASPSKTMKNSETYDSLPRSFSSHKYLAAFIDSDVHISSELYNFLQER